MFKDEIDYHNIERLIILMNYNNKTFKLISSSGNSDLTSNTTFLYKQKDNLLISEYMSENVKFGQIIGVVSRNGEINMSYQQVGQDGKLKTGVCNSKPEILGNGKIRLYEKWTWTSGDKTQGQSVLEEV